MKEKRMTQLERNGKWNTVSFLLWVCITGLDCVLLLFSFSFPSLFLLFSFSLSNTLDSCLSIYLCLVHSSHAMSGSLGIYLCRCHCVFLFSIEARGLSVSFPLLTSISSSSIFKWVWSKDTEEKTINCLNASLDTFITIERKKKK